MNSREKDDIMMSPEIEEAMIDLRKFMFENVYKNPVAKGEEVKAKAMIEQLFYFYKEHLDQLPAKYLRMMDEGRARARGRGLHRRNDGSVCHHQVFGVLSASGLAGGRLLRLCHA